MVLCYVLLANDQHIAYLTSTYTNSSMYFIRFLPLNILIQNYIAHLSYLCMCECLCMCAIAYHSSHTILLSLMNCLDTIILNVLQFYQKQPRHITKQSISCMNILSTTIAIQCMLINVCYNDGHNQLIFSKCNFIFQQKCEQRQKYHASLGTV